MRGLLRPLRSRAPLCRLAALNDAGAAPRREMPLDPRRARSDRRPPEIHRSAHSTNAGGTSLRTIITRKMRSSWSSAALPARAASSVAYRADAAASPVADPRLIVAMSLNISGLSEESVLRSEQLAMSRIAQAAPFGIVPVHRWRGV